MTSSPPKHTAAEKGRWEKGEVVITPWESYEKCLKDSAASKRVQRNSGLERTSLSLIVEKGGGQK